MSLSGIDDILPWCACGILAIMSLLEVSKIKIDPWSALGRLMGRWLNGELFAKVDKLEGEFSALKSTIKEKEAVDLRTRILRFGDEVIHGERHSKEHFDQVLRDITAYENYCDAHPNFKNNQAVLTCERIKEVYKRCQEHGDFL